MIVAEEKKSPLRGENRQPEADAKVSFNCQRPYGEFFWEKIRNENFDEHIFMTIWHAAFTRRA